ncbi:MAG: class I SAM-dependent methyltransferase [Muricauda sp.]|nr:class I SAM-dependent methyltransferase [Allomuricauda sp.]
MEDRKSHWETVYETKTPDQVSWTQKEPKISLDFIRSFNFDKTAKILDVGGGDSNLVDFLLDAGFENISVLDISARAIERAQKRLGKRANKVSWIVSDITEFDPQEEYDVWHDRAAFHFLITKDQIEKYVAAINQAVNGYLILGTFSENGPKKCSGLDITQYTETKMETTFTGFEKLRCFTDDHTTPFGTTQNFMYCSFKKK